MAAKVIHFKKNGSSAPQKFVADDGGNNISAVLSSPRGAETIFLPFYRRRAAREQYFCVLSSPCGAGTIFLIFYRHRAARERYFCRFIVTVRRGNDIFAFYRHRAAREQYSCLFIVTARRGNNIFAVLSSPRSAGTIFLHFSACSAPTNTFPNGFGFCRPTASVQKCGENRARMAAGLMQRGK